MLRCLYTDLECSAREAGDCPIFRLHHSGHVHVTTACRINDVNNLWLPLSCNLREQKKFVRNQQSTRMQTEKGANHNWYLTLNGEGCVDSKLNESSSINQLSNSAGKMIPEKAQRVF